MGGRRGKGAEGANDRRLGDKRGTVGRRIWALSGSLEALLGSLDLYEGPRRGPRGGPSKPSSVPPGARLTTAACVLARSESKFVVSSAIYACIEIWLACITPHIRNTQCKKCQHCLMKLFRAIAMLAYRQWNFAFPRNRVAIAKRRRISPGSCRTIAAHKAK
eukprot:9497735-Pyramimonas_sp.AAC.1